MQEAEINKNLDHNLLSFPGYSIETENNSSCSRVAIYIVVSDIFLQFGDPLFPSLQGTSVESKVGVCFFELDYSFSFFIV